MLRGKQSRFGKFLSQTVQFTAMVAPVVLAAWGTVRRSHTAPVPRRRNPGLRASTRVMGLVD